MRNVFLLNNKVNVFSLFHNAFAGDKYVITYVHNNKIVKKDCRVNKIEYTFEVRGADYLYYCINPNSIKNNNIGRSIIIDNLLSICFPDKDVTYYFCKEI